MLIRRLLRSPALWVAVLVGYWLTLFVATHLPVGTRGLPAQGVDKVVHLAAFAVLALVFAMALRLLWGRIGWRQLVLIWIVIAIYAALDEWSQDWVGRYASVQDWLADMAGAAAALVGAGWWVLGVGGRTKEQESSRAEEQ